MEPPNERVIHDLPYGVKRPSALKTALRIAALYWALPVVLLVDGLMAVMAFVWGQTSTTLLVLVFGVPLGVLNIAFGLVVCFPKKGVSRSFHVAWWIFFLSFAWIFVVLFGYPR